MANDVEHFLICYLYILFSEMSLHVLSPFPNWTLWIFIIGFLGFFKILRYEFFIRYVVHKYFLPFGGLFFSSFQRDLSQRKVLILMKCNLSGFFFLYGDSWLSCLSSLHQAIGIEDFLLCYLLNVLDFYVLHLNLGSTLN